MCIKEDYAELFKRSMLDFENNSAFERCCGGQTKNSFRFDLIFCEERAGQKRRVFKTSP